MKFKSFEDLINQVKGKSNRVVVPGANNAEALEAIKMADDNGLISHGILIGPIAQVKEMVKAAGLPEDIFIRTGEVRPPQADHDTAVHLSEAEKGRLEGIPEMIEARHPFHFAGQTGSSLRLTPAAV